MRDGKRHGQGTETWVEHDRHKEGEWRDGSLYNGVEIWDDDRYRFRNGESE